jgi:hypothetical protein
MNTPRFARPPLPVAAHPPASPSVRPRLSRAGLGAAVLCALVAAGCGTVTRIHAPAPLAGKARWVVLPVTNLAETVQAGERNEAMLDTVLRRHGVTTLERYPAIKEDEVHVLLSDRARYDTALTWARTQHYDYAVTGTVEEWRYKSGNESEPAVGLTVTVVDVNDGKTLWSGSGASVGSSFQNTSGVALELLGTLVEGMTLR